MNITINILKSYKQKFSTNINSLRKKWENEASILRSPATHNLHFTPSAFVVALQGFYYERMSRKLEKGNSFKNSVAAQCLCCFVNFCEGKSDRFSCSIQAYQTDRQVQHNIFSPDHTTWCIASLCRPIVHYQLIYHSHCSMTESH